MAILRFVVTALALAACMKLDPATPAADDDSPPDGGVPVPPADIACAMPADPFATSVLADGVGLLASDELGGRKSDTPGDHATRAFIEDAFRCAGLSPGGDGGSFQQPFTAPDGTAAANVIGYLPGSDPALAGEIVVVGAHHDHLGSVGGQIYNGANDNASGTIAMIAQARALAAQRPRRTVAFVAFGYEEHDGNCEGSEHFAAHAPAALPIADVIYMIDMDMVGTYALAGELSVYGATAGSRGRATLDALAASYADVTLAHEGNADTDDSDFQAFADRQIPYVYFETWDDACYHQPCDDAARIDYAGMARVAQLGRDLIATLAN